jgi:hypothetical protein
VSIPVNPVVNAFTITGSTSQAGVNLVHQIAATLITD